MCAAISDTSGASIVRAVTSLQPATRHWSDCDPSTARLALDRQAELDGAASRKDTTFTMLKDVLIVEDQGLVCAGMKSLLRTVAPQVSIRDAATYEGALALLESVRFDIVFLDLDLRTDRTGLDLLRTIRDRDLPLHVIMLSANDDPEMILTCISAGASGYIGKGSGDETVFERALQTVFQGGIFLPPSILLQDTRSIRREPRPAGAAPMPDLPPRMAEVLYLLCQGLSNKSIAARMGISEGTVRKNYVSELLRHFSVSRRTELMIEISRLGIRIPYPGGSPTWGSGP